MGSFTVPDGMRLHYAGEGAGPPLLLHLGAGCDSGLWQAAGYLGPLGENFTCILFDHRGHRAIDHRAAQLRTMFTATPMTCSR